LSGGKREIGAGSGISNSGAQREPSDSGESRIAVPDIHRLGMKRAACEWKREWLRQ